MSAADATGEGQTGPLRLQFDRSVNLAFRGSSISSDGRLLLHRGLDDALGLNEMAAALIGDPRAGRNGRHRLAWLLRQTIFSRLAGHEDVNEADRLRRERLIKAGARLVRHARYAVFQFAEAALPREVFAGVLDLINGLRGPPPETASA